jgi:hypothetical protein
MVFYHIFDEKLHRLITRHLNVTEVEEQDHDTTETEF